MKNNKGSALEAIIDGKIKNYLLRTKNNYPQIYKKKKPLTYLTSNKNQIIIIIIKSSHHHYYKINLYCFG